MPPPIASEVDFPVTATPQAMADRRDISMAAFERTRMPMVMTDPRQPDNPIVMFNNAFVQLCGYASDEIIGRNCRFMQGPGTDPVELERVREAIGSQRDVTVELLNYRKDGSSFWNQLFVSPIHDEDGTLIYFFASQLDVSEQRRMRTVESGEHRLLREVDHRAKNALALVQGIVRLTRADTAESYSRSVQGRVDALAQAHSILSEAKWHAVPLSRLVQAGLAPFGHTRSSTDGPDVMIGAAQVQPLVLLLHELIANAAEHGSLSVPEGTIVVRWREDAGQITLVLGEHGGPPPAERRTPGFGLTMVDAFVRRQLRGSAAFDWRPEGLETTLMVPVERHESTPSTLSP